MGSLTGVAAANETFLLCCWLMRADKVMLVLNPAWYSSKLALSTSGDAAQATCDTGTIRIEAVIGLLPLGTTLEAVLHSNGVHYTVSESPPVVTAAVAGKHTTCPHGHCSLAPLAQICLQATTQMKQQAVLLAASGNSLPEEWSISTGM